MPTRRRRQNSYRNPNLLADAARTIDHISGGRHILGIGAGWFRRDDEEYGYPFGTVGDRLRALDRSMKIIKDRLERLNPPPRRTIPTLIGGGGEKVTLRIAAEHADIWNGVGDPETIKHKNDVLDNWCAQVGREPSAIERSVGLWEPGAIDLVEDYLGAGITHFICDIGVLPGDWGRLLELLAWRDAMNR